MITPQQAATRHICTTYGCDTPVGEDTYLCRDHIIALDDLLVQVPRLRTLLTPTLQVGKGKPTGTTASGPAPTGSKPPLNLEVIVLADKLDSLPERAHVVAHNDPQAGRVLRKAKLWVDSARAWVDGRPETRVLATCECGGDVTTTDPRVAPTDDDADPEEAGECQACGNRHTVKLSAVQERINNEVREREPEPMTSANVREWVKVNAGIIISADDIKNWAKAHRIRQVKEEREDGRPRRPLYYAADILRVHFDNVERNLRKARHAPRNEIAEQMTTV